ncbi:hypothetical protein ScalyP_jg674, partial [Parmales sp. scaly parma]
GGGGGGGEGEDSRAKRKKLRETRERERSENSNNNNNNNSSKDSSKDNTEEDSSIGSESNSDSDSDSDSEEEDSGKKGQFRIKVGELYQARVPEFNKGGSNSNSSNSSNSSSSNSSNSSSSNSSSSNSSSNNSSNNSSNSSSSNNGGSLVFSSSSLPPSTLNAYISSCTATLKRRVLSLVEEGRSLASEEEEKEGGKVPNPHPTFTQRRQAVVSYRLPAEDSFLNLLHQRGGGVNDVKGCEEYYETEGLERVEGLALWTRREVELFDAGFGSFNGCLRAVSMGMGIGGGGGGDVEEEKEGEKEKEDEKEEKEKEKKEKDQSVKSVKSVKSVSDVIDYHYRFKIPAQYIKYIKHKNRNNKRGAGEMTVDNEKEDSKEKEKEEEKGKEKEKEKEKDGTEARWKRRKIEQQGGAMNDSDVLSQSQTLQTRHTSARSFLQRARTELGNASYLALLEKIRGYNSSGAEVEGGVGRGGKETYNNGGYFFHTNPAIAKVERLEDLKKGVRMILDPEGVGDTGLLEAFELFLPSNN